MRLLVALCQRRYPRYGVIQSESEGSALSLPQLLHHQHAVCGCVICGQLFWQKYAVVRLRSDRKVYVQSWVEAEFVATAQVQVAPCDPLCE